MSKPYYDDERKFEYDAKYLRKVLAEVDENIVLPASLRADALRARLDAFPDAPPKRDIAKSALQFLRSQVFSFQSVVSYALAFAVIMLAAYNLGRGTPEIVDGSISTPPEVHSETAGQGGAEPPTADNPVTAGSAALETERADTAPVADTPVGQERDQSARTAPSSSDAPAQPASGSAPIGGVGGGGEAVPIGENGLYSFVCRYNDDTDPDKAGIPLTLEIVDAQSGDLVHFIDIPDLTEIKNLFSTEDTVGFAGESGEGVLARCYRIDAAGPEAAPVPVFDFAQPGTWKDVRLYDGVLHAVSIDRSGAETDLAAERLPESTTDARCVITLADLADGTVRQAAYVGVDTDQLVSVQNRNVYISYEVAPEEEGAEPELYMAQVKMDGTSLEMVLVP